MATLKQGPAWGTVVRRVTRQLDTMECIEDIEVSNTLEDSFVHRKLPEGVRGTQTILYHQYEKVPATQDDQDEQSTATEMEQPENDILDDLMVEGLEITYPEQTDKDDAVPMVTQEEGPS